MTYGFVKQSGGHVLLSSEEGRGTMVTIYLPRHLGTADGVGEVDGKTMPPQAEAGAVVLLVEDELAVRMVVAEVLSDLGYTVLEADNSQSGLRVVETRARIDLLLTDCRIARRHEWAAARRRGTGAAPRPKGAVFNRLCRERSGWQRSHGARHGSHDQAVRSG